MKTITITGVNLNDLFALPICKAIHKACKDNFAVELYEDKVDGPDNIAVRGDILQQCDNGKWKIKRNRLIEHFK